MKKALTVLLILTLLLPLTSARAAIKSSASLSGAEKSWSLTAVSLLLMMNLSIF